jgi:hypothetical protein
MKLHPTQNGVISMYVEASEKGLPMTLENRINAARANSFVVQHQWKQLRRERSQIREEFHEQLHQWRIARMKQGILIAEMKKNHLLEDRTCASVLGGSIQ